MMTVSVAWRTGTAALAAMLLASGCGGPPPPPEVEPESPQAPVGAEAPEEEPPPRDETPQWVDPAVKYAHIIRPIHFEFNKYRILEEARPILEGIASLLNKNPGWKMLIEGHCDERGTNEYNLTLGEQRALAARRYLVSLGVAESRFQTISYGEERPVDPRHNEEAWAKNRRAEFRVEAPGS